jgi:hypothetical protein
MVTQVGAGGVNVAATALLPFIVMLVGFVLPDRSPLQPEKLQPAAGVAVSYTMSP